MDCWDAKRRILISPTQLSFPCAVSYTNSKNSNNGIYYPSRLIQLIYTVNLNVAKTYINGVHVGTHNAFDKDGVIADGHASTAFLIGSKRTNNQGGLPFKGYLFESAFWNKVLTDSEVASLYKYHTDYFGI